MENRPTDTRRSDRLITQDPDIAQVWPEVAERLASMLRRRGVDPWAIEDVVQEVGLRVLTHRVRFESASDLCRWAMPVARNLMVDHWRSQRREGGVPPADRPAAVDVPAEVENRMALGAVSQCLAQLHESDRQAIFWDLEADAPATRTEGVRLAVRRHRARARLLRLVEGVISVLGGLWGRHLVKRARQPLAWRRQQFCPSPPW